MTEDSSPDDANRAEQRPEDGEASPFEQLSEEVADRDGDPFRELDDAVDSEETDSSSADEPPTGKRPPTRNDPSTGTQPAADTSGAAPEHRSDGTHTDEDQSVTGATAAGSEEVDGARMNFGVGRDGDPEREPAAGLEGAGGRDGDPFEAPGGVFEEMDTEGLDPDRVWQDLSSAKSRGSVGDPTARTYADVAKQSYCEQCEFFSDPPDIACTHEGTEIVEFLDMETVRVVDCPVVAEREQLEDERSIAMQDEES